MLWTVDRSDICKLLSLVLSFLFFCGADETVCVVDKTKGCSQFCKPGYTTYECSCARGWKLDAKNKEKCVPAGTHTSATWPYDMALFLEYSILVGRRGRRYNLPHPAPKVPFQGLLQCQ